MIAFRVEHATSETGAQVEVATLIHEGREFTAMGACVDEANGLIVAYVRRVIGSPQPGHVADLVTFEGSHLGVLKFTGRAHGFHGARLDCYSFEYNGRRYSGRHCPDSCQLIRLRCRKAR